MARSEDEYRTVYAPHYWPIKFQQHRSLNSLNISKQHLRRLNAHNQITISKTRSLLNWLLSDFDSSSWQLNLSTAQNDFSKFRPGWWQFCWMTGVKFNSIHSILVRFLHITQFTVCVAKNLTVFVADSPRCLEWSSMVAAISWALRELSEPCVGWTREPRGHTKSLGARWQYSQATANNVLPVMTASPVFLTRPPPDYLILAYGS